MGLNTSAGLRRAARYLQYQNVIPAQAGIDFSAFALLDRWIPACAGITKRVGFAAVLYLAAATIPARADGQPLTIFIQDGEVLFQGVEMDVDRLTEKLKATGRQNERIYFRMGPNAKTAYTKRVVAAIEAAGFSDIAVMPPPGLGEKEREAPL